MQSAYYINPYLMRRTYSTGVSSIQFPVLYTPTIEVSFSNMCPYVYISSEGRAFSTLARSIADPLFYIQVDLIKQAAVRST